MQRVGCELQTSHSIGPSLCLPTLLASVRLQKVLHKTRWNPDTFLKSGQWRSGNWPAQQTQPPSICCQLNRLITGTCLATCCTSGMPTPALQFRYVRPSADALWRPSPQYDVSGSTVLWSSALLRSVAWLLLPGVSKECLHSQRVVFEPGRWNVLLFRALDL